MHMMWFTERAYHYDPEVEPEKYRELENQILKLRSFYGTPNRFFDHLAPADLVSSPEGAELVLRELRKPGAVQAFKLRTLRRP